MALAKRGNVDGRHTSVILYFHPQPFRNPNSVDRLKNMLTSSVAIVDTRETPDLTALLVEPNHVLIEICPGGRALRYSGGEHGIRRLSELSESEIHSKSNPLAVGKFQHFGN